MMGLITEVNGMIVENMATEGLLVSMELFMRAAGEKVDTMV